MKNDLNITVTDRAQKEFISAIAGQGSEEQGIRITAMQVSPVRLSFQLALDAFEARRPEDIGIEVGSVKIWAGPGSAEKLDGATVDFVDELKGSGFKIDQPKVQKTWTDPAAVQLQALFESEINPGIASHGGFIDLVDFKDGTAYVFMGGGCQGCGSASLTLREGIEARVKNEIPEIKQIIDVTDHASGENPYM